MQRKRQYEYNSDNGYVESYPQNPDQNTQQNDFRYVDDQQGVDYSNNNYNSPNTGTSDVSEESSGLLMPSGQDSLTKNIGDKTSLIIVVFGAVICIYLIISAIIYFCSYVIKNK